MNSIKIMIFLWQLGVVDSLTFLQFCINCGAQYTELTLGEAAGYMSDIGPSVLLAPVQGIATVASFLAMSGRATLTDPATNAAAGVTIASFIGDMKSVIETKTGFDNLNTVFF